MRISSSFKVLPMAAMVLSAWSLTAHAETWVGTATKATGIKNTRTTVMSHVAPVQTGMPVHVVVSLKLRNKSDLDMLTKSMMAGKRIRPLNSAEFKARYSPTHGQVQAVINHLKKSGFTNISVSSNNLLVSADGSAGTVKSAFNADLHSYNVNGRSAFANVNDVMIPQSLGDTVLAVHGLQTVHQYHTMITKPKAMASTFSVTGHDPADFPLIYNASSLPSATNATIGIITQGSMDQTVADLNAFASNEGYPQPNVSVINVGSPSSDTRGVGEWNMDTQDALAAAGGTINQMILYTATTLSDADLTAAYNRVVSDNVAKAINVSLGECENAAQSSGVMASNDQIFQSAVAQGQTFSVASGDSGAFECGGPGTSQSYPSVSPYVISVGGTRVDANGTTYNSESVWSCTDYQSCQHDAGGGAGGGPSLTESAPSWQTAAGVLGGSTMRGTPDISFDADPASGAQVLVNGATQTIGGTSLAAPIFTGFWARIQSANSNSLAFPASAMYQNAAAHPEMFHDVTTGSNGGYSATTGWDYASGWGSLNVANFAAVVGNGGSSNPPPPPAGNTLSNNVPVSNLSLATNTQQVYTFTVPSGVSKVTFRTSGGSGDVDIYVQLGSAPTMSSYMQKSDNWGNNENITLNNPAPGTYYLLLNGYDAPNGFQVAANY